MSEVIGDQTSAPPFAPDTPEEAVAAWIDSADASVQHAQSLVDLLRERAPLYAGRSGGETARLRGYTLAAFGRVGLPVDALPYVLEELESGHEAYAIAAAARALRGLDAPSQRFVPFLLQALERVRFADDAMSFECYKPRWPLRQFTTAVIEILRTFAWLGPHACSAGGTLQQMSSEAVGVLSEQTRSELVQALARVRGEEAEPLRVCCRGGVVRAVEGVVRPDLRELFHMTIVDQDEHQLAFSEFFVGRPSAVAFFYTRCENPNKCSLTISKLARLQQSLSARGLAEQVRLAAFTYDPLYDLPQRLRAFGENRGILFGENMRFFRTPSGVEEIRQGFDLGVGFGPTIVNRHRLELFVLDASCGVQDAIVQTQWDIETVAQRLESLVGAASAVS